MTSLKRKVVDSYVIGSKCGKIQEKKKKEPLTKAMKSKIENKKI